MLKNNALELKEGDLVVIRLTAGEEIIGKIHELTDSYVSLEKPYRPMMTQNGPALAPFSILSSFGSPPIYRDKIVSHYPPDSDIEKQYMQIVSGIDLTTKITNVSAK